VGISIFLRCFNQERACQRVHCLLTLDDTNVVILNMVSYFLWVYKRMFSPCIFFLSLFHNMLGHPYVGLLTDTLKCFFQKGF
jgi:hypothetical protein